MEAIREPADGESVESVARTQAKASGAGPEPGLRDWIGVLAMVTGLVMAIMDVQIVTSSLTQIQGGLSASADEISWVCPASAPMRQKWRVEEGRISGPS